MNSIMSLFTTKEIIIMGSIVLGLLLMALIISILDVILKRKEKNILDESENVELKNEELPINELEEKNIEEEEIVKIEEEVSSTSVIEEKQVEVSEPLIMEFEDETEKSEEEVISSQEQAKIELQKIAEELESPKSLEDTLTSLEMMEEENAIISYQELLETTKEMNIVLADSGDEPISINEIYSKYDDDLNNIEQVTVNDEVYNKEFVSSPCVSPIGEYEKENLAEIQLENTANLEKLDKEIRKTNQFLNILNELKKNLE